MKRPFIHEEFYAFVFSVCSQQGGVGSALSIDCPEGESVKEDDKEQQIDRYLTSLRVD